MQRLPEFKYFIVTQISWIVLFGISPYSNKVWSARQSWFQVHSNVFHVFSVHSVAGRANKTVFGRGGFFFSSGHPDALLPLFLA